MVNVIKEELTQKVYQPTTKGYYVLHLCIELRYT